MALYSPGSIARDDPDNNSMGERGKREPENPRMTRELACDLPELPCKESQRTLKRPASLLMMAWNSLGESLRPGEQPHMLQSKKGGTDYPYKTTALRCKMVEWNTLSISNLSFEFHGPQIRLNSISIDGFKIARVLKWEIPRKTHDIHSFFGFTDYLPAFVNYHFEIAYLLSELQ
ncbi:hypothetical protein BDK51DRAFT_43069 [Blyttiomyces helicus]|uniref:Uncharacterized protein n=1 Tax=Blyttiomyces helicus TaxID=388810 RepID=A0A4P9WQ93_9FUNG|nr:hypothetical protein BDK51DRAFT_43069 [Blyttiomyces helicus]|eukprot:RKO94333.1 hypothetical protein BDK51DRAFT_43069 [Blyttiomyces helicus]